MINVSAEFKFIPAETWKEMKIEGILMSLEILGRELRFRKFTRDQAEMLIDLSFELMKIARYWLTKKQVDK